MTPMIMQLIATKKFRYRKMLAPGDRFEAPRQDGKMLVAIGMAKVAKVPAVAPELPPVPVEPPAAPVEVAATKPKRKYTRRDMRAEK